MNPAQAERCRLCEGPTTSLSAPLGARTLTYARCLRCGYIGLDADFFPSRDEEKRRYLEHRNSPEDPGYRGYLRKFLDTILIPRLPPNARVLDFGSGPSPALSSMLESAGFPCNNYDPFFNPDTSWRNRRYEAILLHEVAEHLHDPRATFLELIPRLNPGGVIIIRTRFLPNELESFSEWWYRMDSTHVGFFSTASLETFFSAIGFRVIQCVQPDSILFGRT